MFAKHQTSDVPTGRGGGSALEAEVLTGGTVLLAGGMEIQIRPLDVGDRTGIAALFTRLSPESRRRRFLTAKPELSRRELSFLTDVDHVRHEALVAIDPSDGSIVGVARYVHEPHGVGVADVAIVVVDELQGRGIGTELAWRLVQRAQVNGFEILSASTLWENRPARALLRRLGFRARARHGGEVELQLAFGPTTR